MHVGLGPRGLSTKEILAALNDRCSRGGDRAREIEADRRRDEESKMREEAARKQARQELLEKERARAEQRKAFFGHMQASTSAFQ